MKIINRFWSKKVDIGIYNHTFNKQEYHETAHSNLEPAFSSIKTFRYPDLSIFQLSHIHLTASKAPHPRINE